ncbi:hypothetical protein KY358_01365 [Candidatus Woesearchaeota archaeon]|nr:hypothetical protein [Candidatus Woesearchaeota archaeon]
MRKKPISILFTAFFALSIPLAVFAAQALPRYGINEQTKECSEFFMGDECMTCTVPGGWKTIEGFQCPQGYDEVQRSSDCAPIKSDFCCTVQHSGANGDCEDAVVNDVEQICAFVEDIDRCGKLPAGWKRAEEIEFLGRVCPSLDYGWLEETLDCEEKMDEPDMITDQDYVIEDKQKKSNIIPIAIILSAIIALLAIMRLFPIKRKQK